MLIHPDFDPIAFSIGPLAVRWYGLTYLFGFAAAWLLGRYRATKPGSGWTAEEVSDLIFFGVWGVFLGGRIGYVVFYNFDAFLQNPIMLLRVWEGGMSFHGGLIGVLIAFVFFARKTQRTFFQVSDFLAPMVPVGLFFGRIGNFINGELWGRETTVPWGMVFSTHGGGEVARHPSQLYQAGLEGLVLFVLLWFYSSKQRPTMAVSGLFLAGYGVLRFIVEFFRQPDSHLGFIALDWLTMGQILSMPMILIGAGMMILAYRRGGQSHDAPVS